MQIKEVTNKAECIRNKLFEDSELAQHIDKQRRYIPIPKVGSGEIEIVIIGQDPTVRREKSRDTIEVVLNLDKQNSLYRYVSSIVEKLGYDIERNLYATNLLKCFYVAPPASIPNLVRQHTPYWIELLKAELEQYPNAVVITLGEPVLTSLVTNGSKKVRDYWGYQGKNQANINNFNYCDANNNLLQRDFFPFPHQPSIRKQFYSNYLDEYIQFVDNCKCKAAN